MYDEVQGPLEVESSAILDRTNHLVGFNQFLSCPTRIPGMEGPGGLQSMGSHRVGHD